MAEPVSSTAVTVTVWGGVTVFGVATGLHPVLLFAGAWGGWWAQSFMPPARPLARINRVAVSAGVAAWCAKAAVGIAAVRGMVPGDDTLRLACEAMAALGFGLVAVPVLGRGVLEAAGAFVARIKHTGGRND